MACAKQKYVLKNQFLKGLIGQWSNLLFFHITYIFFYLFVFIFGIYFFVKNLHIRKEK
jgi:hypothetical protein